MTDKDGILQSIEIDSNTKRGVEEHQDVEGNQGTKTDGFFIKIFKHSLDSFQNVSQELLTIENAKWWEALKHILNLDIFRDFRDILYSAPDPERENAFHARYEKYRKLSQISSTLNKQKEGFKNKIINLLPLFVLSKAIDETHYLPTNLALIVTEYAGELPMVHGHIELNIEQLRTLQKSIHTLSTSMQIGTWEEQQTGHIEPLLLSDPFTMGKHDEAQETWQFIDHEECELIQKKPEHNII